MENKILKKNCNLIFGPKEENQTNFGRTKILGTYFSYFLSAVIFDCVFRVLSLEKKPESKNSYKIFLERWTFHTVYFPSSFFSFLNVEFDFVNFLAKKKTSLERTRTTLGRRWRGMGHF